MLLVSRQHKPEVLLREYLIEIHDDLMIMKKFYGLCYGASVGMELSWTVVQLYS